MEDINSKEMKSRSELKRRAILKGAARVFSEKGYINSSIKNITEEASVAVGTFYTYFRNKEEVLEQIYEEILNMSLKNAFEAYANDEDNAVKRFTSAMTGAIFTYAVNRDLSKILLVKSMGINESFENKRWEILDKINIHMRQVLEHLKNDHSVNIYDIDIYSVILSQSILGVLSYWIDGRFKKDLRDIVFSLCTYHLKALNVEFTYDEINEYISQVLPDDYKDFIK